MSDSGTVNVDVGTEVAPATSMLDAAEPVEVNAEAGEAVPSEAPEGNGLDFDEAVWKWSEELAGKGEKPEWFKEKYKTVEDQAKAYTELEKKLGAFKGAPENGYDLEALGELGKQPAVAHFAEFFKEKNLSQEGFEEVVQQFYEYDQQSLQFDLENELKKLGPNAKQQVTQVNQWINNTFNEDMAGVARNLMVNADSVKFFQAVMANQPKANMPTHDAMQVTGHETMQEVLAEKTNNWSRYKEDENYRKSLSKRLVAAETREKSLRK